MNSKAINIQFNNTMKTMLNSIGIALFSIVFFTETVGANQTRGQGGCKECYTTIRHTIGFPRFPNPGPPGCRRTIEREICLEESKVKQVKTQIRDRWGRGTRLNSAIVDTQNPHCGVVTFTIGVDHGGPEGRFCFESSGGIIFDVELVPKQTNGD